MWPPTTWMLVYHVIADELLVLVLDPAQNVDEERFSLSKLSIDAFTGPTHTNQAEQFGVCCGPLQKTPRLKFESNTKRLRKDFDLGDIA